MTSAGRPFSLCFRRMVMYFERTGVLVAFALTLFLVAGCVTTGDYILLKNEVNQLKKNYYVLDKNLTVLKKDMDLVVGGAMKGVGKETFNAIRDSQEQLSSQVLSLSKDLQVLQGRFDENKFAMDKTLKDNTLEFEILRTRLTKMEEDIALLKQQLADLQKHGVPSVAKKEEESSAKEQGEEAVEAKDLYAASYEAFKDGDYKKAREGFTRFLKLFPDHDLADNAHFWIAEAYFREKDYENAILAYEKLMKDFPKSPKLPAAMLKQAKSFEAIGDNKTAKVIYQLLIEKYPDSSEAKSLSKKKGSK